MTFRNSNLPLLPTFSFAKAPEYLDEVDRLGRSAWESDWFDQFEALSEVASLRREHGADLVHLFYRATVLNHAYNGKARIGGTRGVTEWGHPSVFAHEIGHNLGGEHQPEVAAPSLAHARDLVRAGGAPEWRRYAFAHSWYKNGSPAPDGQWGDYGTSLSYSRLGREPYYSIAGSKVRTGELGIPDQRENQRAFRTTVWDRAGQSLLDAQTPLPPINVRVKRLVGEQGATVQWQPSRSRVDGYYVLLESFRSEQAVRRVTVGAEARQTTVEALGPGLFKLSVFSFADVPDVGRRYSEADIRQLLIEGAEPRAPAWGRVLLEDFDHRRWLITFEWIVYPTSAEAGHPGSKIEVGLSYGGASAEKRFFFDEVEGTHYTFVEKSDGGEQVWLNASYHTFNGESPEITATLVLPDPPSGETSFGDDSGEGDECSQYVTPYWRGRGGFVVRPEQGACVEVTSICSGDQTERFCAAPGESIVELLRPSVCYDSAGGSFSGRVEFRNIGPGGWYWVDGDRNAAGAPLVCRSALRGASAASPLGVRTEVLRHGTFFRHDRSGLAGIVPHLAKGGRRLVAPFWRGTGGIVGSATNGRSVRVRVSCGSEEQTETFYAQDDGLVVELLRPWLCTGTAGEPLSGGLEVEGMEPGGWYWIDGNRNAAVAPLLSLEELGGAPPIAPAGVGAIEGRYGTLFTHESSGLIAIVPRVSRN